MATILIWMSPEPGHILPTIKTARDLVKAGHKVVYQVPSSQREEIQTLGFETVGFFDDVSRPFKTSLYRTSRAASWHYWAISQKYPGALYLEAFRNELLQAALLLNADLLVIDGVFDSILGFRLHEILPSECGLVRLYIHLPYRPIAVDDLSWKRGRMVFLSPREFEIPGFAYDDAFYTGGATFEGSEVTEFSWSAIDCSRRLVYCSFGSQMERYPDVEAALTHIIAAGALTRDCQLIVNAGFLAPTLQALSGENVVICSRVPQSEILKRASVMVSHGGFGSIKDCIYNQVPMLIIPQKWDQPLNARRVLHHRLGLSLEHGDITEPSIAGALDTLMGDQQLSANLEAMHRIFVECDQMQPTAAMLESACQHELG